MPKKRKKLSKHNSNINIELELNKLGTRLHDQNLIMAQKDIHINELLDKLVNNYGDFKTIINLSELLSPAGNTRAREIPRPQNAFMLYRKDISKGFLFAKLKISISECSKAAGYLWENLNKKTKDFWFQLALIAKAIHKYDYPNYKYNPKCKEDIKDTSYNVKKVDKLVVNNENSNNVENETNETDNNNFGDSTVYIKDEYNRNDEVNEQNFDNYSNYIDIDYINLFDNNYYDVNYLIDPMLYENNYYNNSDSRLR
jgi:hypothetical protein